MILLAAVLTGAVCGLWNGFLVAVLQIQPIVATLMLMVAGRGVAQLITEGQIITFAHPALAHLGSGSLFYLPMPVIIACAMLLLLWLLTRKTALGLFIEAVGINVRSARNAGISTRLILISVYVICGVCAAVAGVIITADIRGADANNAGLWLELDAILAVVIGGGSLLGGRFNLLLALVGALIIQSMNTGILLAGYRPELNLVLKALVVLAASGVELDAIAAVVIGGTLLTGVLGTFFGVLIQGLIQTYITFDGTLSSWWTKIVIGILLFAFIVLQKGLSAFWVAKRA